MNKKIIWIIVFIVLISQCYAEDYFDASLDVGFDSSLGFDTFDAFDMDYSYDIDYDYLFPDTTDYFDYSTPSFPEPEFQTFDDFIDDMIYQPEPFFTDWAGQFEDYFETNEADLLNQLDWGYEQDDFFGNVMSHDADTLRNKYTTIDTDRGFLEYTGSDWIYANGLYLKSDDVGADNPITMTKEGETVVIRHEGDLTINGIDLNNLDELGKARLNNIEQDFTIITDTNVILKKGNSIYVQKLLEFDHEGNVPYIDKEGTVQFNYAEAENIKAEVGVIKYATQQSINSYNKMIKEEQDELFLRELASRITMRQSIMTGPTPEDKEEWLKGSALELKKSSDEYINGLDINQVKDIIMSDKFSQEGKSGSTLIEEKTLDLQISKIIDMPTYKKMPDNSPEGILLKSNALHTMSKTTPMAKILDEKLTNYDPNFDDDQELNRLNKQIEHQLETTGLVRAGLTPRDVTANKLNEVALQGNDELRRRILDYDKYGIENQDGAQLYLLDTDVYKLVYDFTEYDRLTIEKGNSVARLFTFLNAKHQENAMVFVLQHNGKNPENVVYVKTDPNAGKIEMSIKKIEDVQNIKEYYVIDTPDTDKIVSLLPEKVKSKYGEFIKAGAVNPNEEIRNKLFLLELNHIMTSKEIGQSFGNVGEGNGKELGETLNDLNQKDKVGVTFKTIWGFFFGGNAKRTDEALLLMNNLEGQTRVKWEADDTQDSYVDQLFTLKDKAVELKQMVNQDNLDPEVMKQNINEFAELSKKYGIYDSTSTILSDYVDDMLVKFRRDVRFGNNEKTNIKTYYNAIEALKEAYPKVAEGVMTDLVTNSDSYFSTFVVSEINENDDLDDTTKSALTSQEFINSLQYTFNDNLIKSKDIKESTYEVNKLVIKTNTENNLKAYPEIQNVIEEEKVQDAIDSMSRAMTEKSFGTIGEQEFKSIMIEAEANIHDAVKTKLTNLGEDKLVETVSPYMTITEAQKKEINTNLRVAIDKEETLDSNSIGNVLRDPDVVKTFEKIVDQNIETSFGENSEIVKGLVEDIKSDKKVQDAADDMIEAFQQKTKKSISEEQYNSKMETALNTIAEVSKIKTSKLGQTKILEAIGDYVRLTREEADEIGTALKTAMDEEKNFDANSLTRVLANQNFLNTMLNIANENIELKTQQEAIIQIRGGVPFTEEETKQLSKDIEGSQSLEEVLDKVKNVFAVKGQETFTNLLTGKYKTEPSENKVDFINLFNLKKGDIIEINIVPNE